MKKPIIILFSLLLLAAMNSSAYAENSLDQIEDVIVPITKDGYLKEKWSPAYVWRKGYISVGFNSTVYKEARSRIFLEYNLSDIRALGIGTGDIESANLHLHHYHTEKYAPTYFNFQIHPSEGVYDQLTGWPSLPLKSNHTLERTVPKQGGLREIDITPLIKAQLLNEIPDKGLSINIEDEKIHGVLYYSTRCHLTTLFYQPYCNDSQIPSILLKVNSSPPPPPTLINPYLEISAPKEINLEWVGDEDLYYQVELSHEGNFNEIATQSEIQVEQSFTYQMFSVEKIYWRVITRRSPDSDITSISEIGEVILVDTVETEEIVEMEQPPTEVIKPKKNIPISDEPVTENNPGDNEHPIPQKEIKGERDEKELKNESNERENINSMSIQCIILKKIHNSSKLVKCQKIKSFVKSIQKISNKHDNYLLVNLRLPDRIITREKYTHCNYPILNHLGCEEFVNTFPSHYLFNVDVDGATVDPLNIYKQTNGGLSFRINMHPDATPKVLEIKLSLATPNTNTVKIGFQKVELELKRSLVKPLNKPFRFPFKQPIGVTQWHGMTKFSSPHKGIDFGANQQNIYALGNGKVFAMGYDTYRGECYSGGKYLNIQHDNGYHSVYMHLQNVHPEIEVGKLINKGEIIAVSGNSGAYNCQPLGYHLHLETRKEQNQSTHTDPVKLINYNWDLVPTLGHEKYPGRLTGNNPHPGS